jgi:concanavalin A-like lectin/glucanase superfamily protein
MSRYAEQFNLVAAALIGLGLVAGGAERNSTSAEEIFRAGAYAVDTSPRKLPAIVNGYTFERIVDKVHDPLFARCLVLDDGSTRVAIVVVDICVMPRDLIDRAKQIASQRTGIPTNRMLISATHTHSAVSVMPALGSNADPDYVEYLPGRIAEGIRLALQRLEPAQIGWTVAEAAEHTHSRRWIMRPDQIGTDPFGEPHDRAKMCPAYEDPLAVGPAGPVDADLTLLSVRSPDGRPIALLANYGMHYFHDTPISPGYYGRFARKITKLIDPSGSNPDFMAAMSQGTSGDQMYMDYSRAKPELNIDTYSDAIAQVALRAYRKIEHRSWVPLAMAETVLPLGRRVPDEERLARAREVLAAMGDRGPKNRPEIFARELIYLTEDPTAELKLQALRIGDLGVTAIPCEVYGITGLKIKAKSPFVHTFNVALANGEEGYIPPAEQHSLGGYSTWEARTAGLEEGAEARIVETLLGLLEGVSEKPQREIKLTHGDYAKAVLRANPVAYWRMSEFGGPLAGDCTGRENHGQYEDLVAFYLEGPAGPGFSDPAEVNRAVHFAGGRLKATVVVRSANQRFVRGANNDFGTVVDAPVLGQTYSVEMWIYNGMPGDVRPVAGYFFSRGVDGAEDAPGDHLGIGGTATAANRLIFFNGNALDELLEGKTRLETKTWYHVAMVRQGRKVTVYLDGNPEPEIVGDVGVAELSGPEHVLIGGRNDNFANFAGKIDEVAIFDRALSREEIVQHYARAGHKP